MTMSRRSSPRIYRIMRKRTKFVTHPPPRDASTGSEKIQRHTHTRALDKGFQGFALGHLALDWRAKALLLGPQA